MTGHDPACLAAFPPDRRYLIGVSGGRDSVALLHWLKARGYRRLIVCHLDHQLRGAASRKDGQFVRRLAERNGFPFEIAKVDLSERTGSIEAAGRAARLELFTKVGRKRRCPTIFLGHHADDQVETFLLRLFRGAGRRGLGAMQEVSQVGPLKIVRPFLGVWRAEIDAYVAEHRLKYREDATNAEVIARRNRVRHEIVPELEKRFGRNLRSSLWRAANVLAEEDALLETLVPHELADGENLQVRTLTALPRPLQRRAILRWLRVREVPDAGYETVEAVRRLLDPKMRVAKVNLPNDLHARRRAGVIFLE
jgi:tRNA(Ile)-lysidine synthase